MVLFVVGLLNIVILFLLSTWVNLPLWIALGLNIVVVTVVIYSYLKKLLYPMECLVKFCNDFSYNANTFPSCSGSYEIQELRNAVMTLLDNNRTLHNQAQEIFKEAAHELKSPLAILKKRIDLYEPQASYTKEEFIQESKEDIEIITAKLKELLFLKSIEREMIGMKELIYIEDQCDALGEQFRVIVEHKELEIIAKRNGNFELLTHKKALLKLLLAMFENVFIHAKRGTQIEIKTDGESKSITIINVICDDCDDKLFSSNIGSKIIKRSALPLGYTFSAKQIENRYITNITFLEEGEKCHTNSTCNLP